MMEERAIKKVTRKVIRQFPEMKGAQPTVRRRSGSGKKQHFELTYKGKVEVPGGRTLRRVVRVVADDSGSVIRMSTSK
jgi:hypothetical protein